MTGNQHKLVGAGFGIAACVYAAKTGIPEGAYLGIGSVIGCMLPDIDHDQTKLGRKRKVVTQTMGTAGNIVVVAMIIILAVFAIMVLTGFKKYDTNYAMMGIYIVVAGIIVLISKRLMKTNVVKWATHHRGFMHTLWPMACIALGLLITNMPAFRTLIIGLDIGYASHLLADMLTVAGCPILWPICWKNIRILKLQTKSNACWVAAAILAALPIIAVYLLT